MFLLNEIIQPGPSLFMVSAFLRECEEVPFKKGDSVCIVDGGISAFRNADALDEFIPVEKRIRTLFENVNRRGEITGIKFKSIKRSKGRMVFKTVKIKVSFPGDLFVEIGNHEFIRRMN
jgi:hypothetical protein